MSVAAGPPDPARPHDGPAAPDPDGDPEEVGTVGEEAVRLLGVLTDALGGGHRHADERAADEPDAAWGTGHANGAGPGEGAVPPGFAGLVDLAAEAWREVDEHVATGSAECRWCPVCRVVHAVRSTSPEVRAHLGTAARSLLQAAGTLLAEVASPTESDPTRRRDPAHPTEEQR